MADKVLTLAGTSCPVCPPTHLTVVKRQRYPHGRHCTELNAAGEKNCRCKKWAAGRGGEKVSLMCQRAGREFKIGSKTLKVKE